MPRRNACATSPDRRGRDRRSADEDFTCLDRDGRPRSHAVARPGGAPVAHRPRVLRCWRASSRSSRCTTSSRCARCGRPGARDQARPVDAIVVMGAAQYDGRPSPQLAARLDHVSTVAAGARADRRRDRRQPAGRPVHRGRGVGRATSIDHGVPADGDPAGERGHVVVRVARGRRRRCCTPRARPRAARQRSVPLLAEQLIAEELGLVGLRVADAAPVRRDRMRTAFEQDLEEAAGIAVGRIIGFERLLSTHRLTGIRLRDRIVAGSESSVARSMGSGVIGNTAVSGTVIQGSSPCSPAQQHGRSFSSRPSGRVHGRSGSAIGRLIVCWMLPGPIV